MPIQIDDLLSLDLATVQSLSAQLGATLEAYAPEVDARRGALGSVLTRLAGVLAAKRAEEFTRLQRSQSLAYIAADPTLADDDIVDNVAANFRLTRRAGANASGPLTIVVSALQTVVIPAGAVFSANGRTFVPTRAFVARTASSLRQSDSDKVLTPLPDGNYAFTIDVTDEEPGAAGLLAKDTLLTLASPPLNYVKSFASADFTGGTDGESNASLIERLLTGVASQTLSDRPSMRALLLAQPDFAGCVASSIIGFGDAEMLRDRHALWPGATGGRVDWYIRTQSNARLTSSTKTATLVSRNSAGNGIWQLTFTRDEAAGVYDVPRIVQEGTEATTEGTYAVVSDTRGIDLSAIDGARLPDITDAAEAAYSRFQTIVLQFADVDTPVTADDIGTTRDYDCVLRSMPLIADISDYVTQLSRVHAAADVLVRAPVPCFVQLGISLELPENAEAEVDTETVATALADLVNGQFSFTGRLPASILAELVQSYLPRNSAIAAMLLVGTLRQPDGTVVTSSSRDMLVVPNDPGSMTTGKTVAFFLDSRDVSITVATVEVPET